MSEDRSERQPATLAFLVVNLAVYALLAWLSGGLDIPAGVIVGLGGLLPLEWLDGQYWRLLSYGFLHFGLVHVGVNSACLIAWGVPLERMLGSSRLVVLYLASIVIAGAGSIALHEVPFVSAGASGGVSGLLGALFLLWLARRVAIPASFFAINIGLNVAIAFLAPNVDWQAHLSGFVGGMALAVLVGAIDRPRRE